MVFVSLHVCRDGGLSLNIIFLISGLSAALVACCTCGAYCFWRRSTYEVEPSLDESYPKRFPRVSSLVRNIPGFRWVKLRNIPGFRWVKRGYDYNTGECVRAEVRAAHHAV